MRSLPSTVALAAVLLVLFSANVVVSAKPKSASSANTDLADGDGSTSYYGMLDLPPSYFNHPDSEAAINRLQHGHVLLTSSHYTVDVPVQKDGSFVLYNLPFGTYLLQADYHDFTFPTVRVDVQYKDRLLGVDDEEEEEDELDAETDDQREEEGQEETPRQQKRNRHSGRGSSKKKSQNKKGGKKVRVAVIRTYFNDFPVKPLRGAGVDEQNPAIIPVAGMHEYYIPRQQFSILDILKNPMILMMLVSFGLMGITKLFPEEEMKESQKMSREWQKKLFDKATKAAAIEKKKE